MLYYLFYQSGLFEINVLRYITFRSSLAAVVAFLVSIFSAPVILRILQRKVASRSLHAKDSEALSDIHSGKAGTPIMGGLIIIAGTLSGVLLACDLSNMFVIGGIFVVVAFGMLGFIDDYLKLFNKKSKGLTKSQKLLWQSFMTFLVAVLILRFGMYYRLYPEGVYEFRSADTLSFPVFKKMFLQLGPWFYLVWAFFVVGGTSNGVNLTDGLDGLAVGCILVVISTFAVITYVVSRVDTSSYLNFLYAPGAAELVVFCISVAGACLGFLWFNSYPAQVFMGDTGSLFLGAFVGYVALVIKQEFLLILIGGIFVIETGSVILQVFSFRVFGKRIFKVAPIHHHFEIMGLKEPKITVRFWIVQIILALICLASLKLR